MKKKLALLLCSVCLTFVLSACANNSKTSVEETTNNNSSENTKESSMTVAALLDNVYKAMEDVSSQTTEMTITSTNKSADQNESFEFSGISKMIVEPFISHSRMEMTGANDFNMVIETYYDTNAVYSYNSMLNTWSKNDIPQTQMVDPKVSIEKLKEFAHLFEIKETSDSYILTVSGNGQDVMTFLNEWAKETVPSLEQEQNTNDIDEALSSSTFELHFDKKTFRNKEMHVTMDIEQKPANSEKIQITTDISVIVTGYNNVDKIEIPDEAKNVGANPMPTGEPATDSVNAPTTNMPEINQEDIQKQIEEATKQAEKIMEQMNNN